MSFLRRLRRRLAADEPYRTSGIFREHRSRFDAAYRLVRLFYGLQLVLLQGFLGHWPRWLAMDSLPDPRWPVIWVTRIGTPLGASLLIVGYLGAVGAVILAPGRRSFRVGVCLFLFLLAALDNSFGKIDHGYHLWIFASFVLIFLPDGPRRDLARSVGARQRYLLLFATAQASFLMAYSLAGFWKLWIGLDQLTSGDGGILAPRGFAYVVATRLLMNPTPDSVLGPFVIDHPLLGWLILMGGIYVETFALVTLFRPSLLRLWGLAIVGLHLGSLLILTIGFHTNVLLAIPLLIAAPGSTRLVRWWRRAANLPGIPMLRRVALPTARRLGRAAAVFLSPGSPANVFRNPGRLLSNLRARGLNLLLRVRESLRPGFGASCIVCGWEGRRFGYTAAISVDQFRADEICLACGSNQRTRDLLEIATDAFDLEDGTGTIVDVGGAPATRIFFDRVPGARYLLVDRYKAADVRSDVTAIDLPDESADAFLCSHVLEHVDACDRAMAELLRILKRGRTGIVLVPQVEGLPVSRRTGANSFDGYGHLWDFGDDFPDLLRAAGFEVETIRRPTGSYHVVRRTEDPAPA